MCTAEVCTCTPSGPAEQRILREVGHLWTQLRGAASVHESSRAASAADLGALNASEQRLIALQAEAELLREPPSGDTIQCPALAGTTWCVLKVVLA